jgi:hypothetical protein
MGRSLMQNADARDEADAQAAAAQAAVEAQAADDAQAMAALWHAAQEVLEGIEESRRELAAAREIITSNKPK